MGHFYRLAHDATCVVCDRPRWCMGAPDGTWIMCMHEAYWDGEPGLPRTTRGGDTPYWLYPVPADRRGDVAESVGEAGIDSEMEAAPPEVCDRAYRALLAALPLSAAHRSDLRQRGLSDAEMAVRGYGSLAAGAGPAALAQVRVPTRGVPGFYDTDWGTGLSSALGLLIPVRDIAGRIVALQVRPDTPVEGSKYVWVSSRAKGGASCGAPVHAPLRPPVAPTLVVFTEGSLKADIATALLQPHRPGTLCLGLPGLGGHAAGLELLEVLRVAPDQVAVALDCDDPPIQRVVTARHDLFRALYLLGYEPEMWTWGPDQGKGLDDYLLWLRVRGLPFQ